MLNSSEEQSYWYFRLNGFFLIDNFVIHKSENIKYSADADLIGVRTPFVYEEIGGQSEDWDQTLFKNFDTKSLIGIICQVKGGAIGDKELFREPYLSYSLARLGLTADNSRIAKELGESAIVSFQNEFGQNCQIAKLLITRDEPKNDINYLWLTLDSVYDFIRNRIEKYPKEKYADRNFFSSIGLQTIIEMNELDARKFKKL
ncbi:hypothetical protein [Chryseobacterium sp. FH1]|uniref:hypothetical protein n=1 Tax=Chryseobacterium sp. FH1 TaxID=1233951 RepID=UPI00068A6BC9|nr:hypothetical protein [Chryseobacterium sp. FH1]